MRAFVTHRNSSPGSLGVFVSISAFFLFRFLVAVTRSCLNKNTHFYIGFILHTHTKSLGALLGGKNKQTKKKVTHYKMVLNFYSKYQSLLSSLSSYSGTGFESTSESRISNSPTTLSNLLNCLKAYYIKFTQCVLMC